MNKIKRDLPIYALTGAILFVGVTNASQAEGAWTSSEKLKITALSNRVALLESSLEQLSETVNTGNSSLEGYKDSLIRFVAIQNFTTSCPIGSSKLDPLAPSFSAGGKTLVECLMTVPTRR